MGLTTEAVGYLEKSLTRAVLLGGMQQNATMEFCKLAWTWMAKHPLGAVERSFNVGTSANVQEKFKNFGFVPEFAFLGEVSILLHALWLVGFPAMKMVPNFAMIEIELRKTVLVENISSFKKAVEEVQLETAKLL